MPAGGGLRRELLRPAAARRGSSARAFIIGVAMVGIATIGCGPDPRALAMHKLQAPTPRERAEGIRALGKLGKPDDDELWVAIERMTRDPSVQVRLASAESLERAPKSDDRAPDERGALADDALSSDLSDLDESVRIAAARVLGDRCNPRSIAYLQGAFSRSGPAVRAQLGASLARCGQPLQQVLARAEEVRRMHALEKLGSNIPAWRAAAARELGLLGRPDDVAKIAPLTEDRDGTIAAAAAEGLGLARAESAIPALQKLAGDEVPLIASAAIDSLESFGSQALSGARAALVEQAESDGPQAVQAAGALLELSPDAAPAKAAGADAKAADPLCAVALRAQVPAAAALLARGCPPAPFGDALAALLPPRKEGKAKGGAKSGPAPLDAAAELRASPLLEALAQSAAAQTKAAPAAEAKYDKTMSLSDKAGAALGVAALYGHGGFARRACEVAAALRASGAAPAITALLERELKALDAERAAEKPRQEDHEAAARELAEAAMRAPAGDRQKIARLMEMVKARQAKSGAAPRKEASERLRELLSAEAAPSGDHGLLAAALRAALALEAKGAAEAAAKLKDDPDPLLMSAARGEPAKLDDGYINIVDGYTSALPAECVFARAPPAVAHPDAGNVDDLTDEERRAQLQTYVTRAPGNAAKPGCLAAFLAMGPAAAAPEGIAHAARATLWSDDGAERAAACRVLAQLRDEESRALRDDLTHDPERRVRDACAATSAAAETAPSTPR